MSSGFFPLNPKTDPNGVKLAAALRLIKEVWCDQRTAAYTLTCAEDGIADGVSLGELHVAKTLVQGCLGDA